MSATTCSRRRRRSPRPRNNRRRNWSDRRAPRKRGARFISIPTAVGIAPHVVAINMATIPSRLVLLYFANPKRIRSYPGLLGRSHCSSRWRGCSDGFQVRAATIESTTQHRQPMSWRTQSPVMRKPRTNWGSGIRRSNPIRGKRSSGSGARPMPVWRERNTIWVSSPCERGGHPSRFNGSDRLWMAAGPRLPSHWVRCSKSRETERVRSQPSTLVRDRDVLYRRTLSVTWRLNTKPRNHSKLPGIGPKRRRNRVTRRHKPGSERSFTKGLAWSVIQNGPHRGGCEQPTKAMLAHKQ